METLKKFLWKTLWTHFGSSQKQDERKQEQQKVDSANEFCQKYPEWFKVKDDGLYALVNKSGAYESLASDLIWCPVRFQDDIGWDVKIFQLRLYNRFGDFCKNRLTAGVFVELDNGDFLQYRYRNINPEESPPLEFMWRSVRSIDAIP